MNRLRPSRSEIVTTVVVVALVVLGVVALWPRAEAPADGPAPAVAAAADLAPLRARAALEPCPTATQSTGTGAGPLAGVRVPCLGAPGTVDLAAALAGRTALLNVWASWCAPCRAELPALAEYAARPGAVPVIGIDVRDADEPALTLLADLGVHLPAVTDPDGALAAALALPPAVPLSYVLRPDGSVVAVDPPVPFASADDVAAAVDRLRTAA